MNVQLLRDSFERVMEHEQLLTPRFYEILFTRYPQSRSLFGRGATERQQQMLQEALVAVIDHLEDSAWLANTLGALGAKHVEYGVTMQMYPWVGECLIETLAEITGDEWTSAHTEAWSEAYNAIAGLMQAGMRPDVASPAPRKPTPQA
jgi:hemoglobin-like flavoprotein